MPIPSLAPQHPLAWQECLAIAGSGYLKHVHAMSAFSVAFDSLFNGPGNTPWAGATARLQDFCTLVPGTFDPRYFEEPFWGGRSTGVVAAFCELTSGRPVLMSVVPFNGPSASDPVDEVVAKFVALRNARARSVDL